MSRHGDADLRAGKAPSQRQLRVGEELRHALADILRRADFRDPDLHDLNVTVSEVRISPDLKNATAFVMPLGGGHPEQIKALNRVSAYLRSQVAKAMRLQHVPRLSFQVDVSFDYAQRIDQLLHRPDVQRDLDHDHDGHEDADDGADEGAEEGTERHDGP
ncbi:30S ribosome-binding factor RbfA [Nitrospirillum amazonense]|uniref:Ribosome-binding factor A n=1 Tax=Nitrospirillum amazonense TaxID=28077 RepID=A0A560K410_9PROT|nr:30S ribosome-binding factor RbfA [Nitrospirillum amazonense]MDG3440303.1 30S ribosome-binding factor RbfA [Nitrospirillum amazonense]TWB75360.1 ribosome-binding factor A [Nitrospirillum amazonense]